MNIVTLLGSPRKRGNTATVLGWFEGQVAPAHRVERIDVVDHTVHGCRGCNACHKVLDAPGCRQGDEAVAIFQRMMAADLVVYATPLYNWSFTAQLKALMDRHYCLVKWQGGARIKALLAGRRTALLVTCADGVEDNADLIPQIFEREMDYLGCKVAGQYVVPHCTRPSELGEAAAQAARTMARELVGV
jgi:multimeric flavodoxin WrbA